MATVRIEFKKVNTERDLGYLNDWYCPLEKATRVGPDLASSGDILSNASIRLAPAVSFSGVVPNIMRKKVMAGL